VFIFSCYFGFVLIFFNFFSGHIFLVFNELGIYCVKVFYLFVFVFGSLNKKSQLCTPKQRERVKGKRKKGYWFS
jgi:hypothetical protein